MKDIKKTSDIVKFILQTKPRTRDSKDYLVKCVYEYINPTAMHLPYCVVMEQRKLLNLPPYGSITRSMRKLQKAYPELRASDEVDAWRKVNEEIVKDYARSVTV